MKTKITTILLLFSLSACNKEENVASQYLLCYALDPFTKKECTVKLAKKYITEDLQHDQNHVQNFQFSQEKQGFKEFLQENKLPCVSINDGPEFDKKAVAYLVQCDKHKYYMRFDYEDRRWNIVK